MLRYFNKTAFIFIFLLIVYLFFYAYKDILYPNVEKNILKQINTGDEVIAINQRYDFNDLMGDYDYLIFTNGVMTETREKIFAIRKDKLIRIFYWKLDFDGEVSKNQIMIDSSLGQAFYRCDKNSSFKATKVDVESNFYYIKPLGCDVLYGVDIDMIYQIFKVDFN